MAGFGRIYPIFLIFGVLVLSTPVQAEYRFEFGHWLGQSHNSDEGHFDSCFASLHNLDDQWLFVRLGKDFDLSIGVYDGDWTAKQGKTVPIEAWLDHSFLYGGLAVAISRNAYYMQLSHTDRSLNLMRGAQKMLIQIRDQSALFELNGVGPALNSLVACVKHGRDEHSTT